MLLKCYYYIINARAFGDFCQNKEKMMKKTTEELMEILKQKKSIHAYFTEEIDGLDLEKIGPAYENHERFPNRVNSEFIELVSRDHIRMRVWERGSGETWACGTGATASAVASILMGYTDPTVKVSLRGGDLTIHWNRDTNHVYMTGPAVEVFHGEIED